MSQYPHYFKKLPPGCTHVDVYRVLDLFGVVDPPIQHAVKKLLCAGERGSKTMPQDIAEAIATLQRWQQMREEERSAPDLREAVADIREIFENEGTAFDISNTPDVWTSQPAPASQTMPPADCRQRLMLEGKAYPRSGCAVCGQFSPRWRDCYALMVAPKPAPASEPTLRDDVERIRAVFAELPREHLEAAMDRLRADREEDPEEDPEPAPAPEDAERAAYLARWKDAPEWAEWLAEDEDGECGWYGSKPSKGACAWHAQPVSSYCRAGDFMLRSFHCEPRPVQGLGP